MKAKIIAMAVKADNHVLIKGDCLIDIYKTATEYLSLSKILKTNITALKEKFPNTTISELNSFLKNDCLEIIVRSEPSNNETVELGFIDEDGNFFNVKDAFLYAEKIGQLKETAEDDCPISYLKNELRIEMLKKA